MRKIKIVLLSVLLGLMLCACGETTESRIQQTRIDAAKSLSTSYVITALDELAEQPEMFGVDYKDLTLNELSRVFEECYRISADGYAISNALKSFESGLAEAGALVSIGEAEATVDGSEIIVDVEVLCEKRYADIEIIYNNDLYDLRMTSAAFNTRYTMAEKMAKAGLNTIIGMGTVFVMLIIISFIISLFGIFSKAGKKHDKTAEGIDRAVKQIEENESAELASDAELVAVIAAAVAAYEGASNTNGFTVRSVRKIKRQ